LVGELGALEVSLLPPGLIVVMAAPPTSDLRGTGGHSASVLGRAVIEIYTQSMRDPARAARTLDLIDAMVLPRS
jgi:hypothetical protein